MPSPTSATSLGRWLVVGLLGCAQPSSTPPPKDPRSEPQPERERVPVEVASETGAIRFSAEIADEPLERERGLMWRTTMGDDQGMLFLFPSSAPRTFWMHNTILSLDIIFIQSDKTILGVVPSATPRTDSPRSVPGDSQYVLEINGGLSAKLGIKAGQKVDFYAPAALH